MALIQGRVVDYDNDRPLPDVTVAGVSQDGTVFKTTITNEEGKFALNDPGFDSLYSKISFSKEGYATQSMRPASANNVDIPLPKAGTLATVVLTVKQNKGALLAIIAIAVLIGLYFFIVKKGIKL